MVKTNMADVKARFAEYLDRAARGERIVICRHNKPVAELRAIEEARLEPRPIGPLPGRPVFKVPSSFFEPMEPDELAQWEGGSNDPLDAGKGTGTPKGGRASRAAEGRRPYGPPAPRTTRRRS